MERTDAPESSCDLHMSTVEQRHPDTHPQRDRDRAKMFTATSLNNGVARESEGTQFTGKKERHYRQDRLQMNLENKVLS